MPGIHLLDFSNGEVAVDEVIRDRILVAVHAVIIDAAGETSRHSNFTHVMQTGLNASCKVSEDGTVTTGANLFILEVDGKKTKVTKKQKVRDQIRERINLSLAEILGLPASDVSTRYRVYNSSFG